MAESPHLETNWSGSYSSDNIYVEVECHSDNTGGVLVSYINNSGSHVSEAVYNGVITETLSFRTNDGWTFNDYSIQFQEGSIHLQANSTGESEDGRPAFWYIPDIDEVLEKD